ncbi:maltose alpha-D-glucosyltransferase [Cereibacter sphaeroides]|uniref:maltose alpha-D-glucosyltransferase n=1 Tax=Cereibacter sphaeroides TaxID=1063 RepID=UPI001F1A3061|nr:maltose alpha-D-glucosyltransferase [Cereibacter sphaeroides]MCE6961513.1 maltose alpha-D-glucosyltransferase [Cereibacter sphaeroides]MCE6967828.1 maltose alpha-D-glucosyltransferase [Cereibacter sphaeroides]MCE6972584.1 maltose alpha-D-glucosyltransferase [Cereibacter sphaeroides]
MNQPVPPATVAVRRTDGIDRSQSDWYKDAIIYQLHIKAFQDANGDGIGDFAGLMQRLDYVQALGVTAIWLLPFYPSPLRDDGYDISDYRSINPSYGAMRDFKLFVQEAHRRGLRVITELVINHTSDQHPWFQRARRARPGSVARDWYVWSDTDQKFPETRIIFLDTEKSNWTWDPVAGAYYWHRFYSHQPDLNFDNPRVLEEVLKVMRMWLEMGVDGLRLDAIPYLVEREGTNNENLPETHDVLKRIRADLDAHFPDRMLLAEANQWPEDTRPYFGEGDECHMGFHFPLMPRMYMALAQADRHPITDIIRQTPEIPEPCQWGIFLRNHDELTLEMVTAEERDYMWRFYAEDARARINLGIRRRLAPLMKNDRRKIELLNQMLMTMPGTPIIYYGDEIGMGDNYYLGDRDGVRTPMQWSADRNGGFSRCNPQQLYLPVILDPVYGHQAINVEAQAADPSSLLNWMRRLITVRKQHSAFGRGTMALLYPRNRKVLAYVRSHEGTDILCVANLADTAQAVELDLSRFRGAVPVELTGRSAFPPVGELPYMLTLPPYGFYWFVLSDQQALPSWHQPMPETLPEFITLTTRDGRAETAVTGREKGQLETDVLPSWLPLQRWFAAKEERIGKVSLAALGSLSDGHALVRLEAQVGGESQQYFLPLSTIWGEEQLRAGAPKLSYTLAKVRRGAQVGALIDGALDDRMAVALLDALRQGRRVAGPAGEVVFDSGEALGQIAEPGEPRYLGAEQSNISIAFSDRLILKLYRRLQPGEQPDVEVARFLTEEAGFTHTPRFLGVACLRPQDGPPTVLASAFAYVANMGDAWRAVLDALVRDLSEHGAWSTTETPAAASDVFSFPLTIAGLLGQRTAELHRAFATPTEDPAFQLEPLTPEIQGGWARGAADEARAMLRVLERQLGTLADETRPLAEAVLSRREVLLERLRRIEDGTPSGALSRIHGDYHLGQVLLAQDDVAIIDFEGEPRRSLDERRRKSSPLRDVAGMLRSFDYAAAGALLRHSESFGPAAELALQRAEDWRRMARAEFLAAYEAGTVDLPSLPADLKHRAALLDLFLVQKAVYETSYELGSRPAWVGIPLRGLIEILDSEAA